MGLLKTTIEELERPAILLGNGINLLENTFENWQTLLEKIAGVQIESKGLSNTEIYDFIDLKSHEEVNLKKQVSGYFKNTDLHNLKIHKRFIELVMRKGCPVLTTNFDLTLEKASNLNFFRTKNRGFSRYYPWDMYSGENKFTDPIDGFGIYHIHGMTKYPDSIRLGLTDYMGSVEKARKWIHHGEESLFRGKNQRDWRGKYSWLHIWFNMPLIIVGLGMNPDEVFIRWLLIERRKYFKKFPEREKGTYYLSKGDGDRINNFLINLNISHKSALEYEDLYS